MVTSKSNTRNTKHHITNIKRVIPDLASNYFGASGVTKLNEAGDRSTSNYQIWSYRWEGPAVRPYVAGLYDSVTGTVSWHEKEMKTG